MFGPFENSPFTGSHFLPLMACGKPDGSVRISINLSWLLSSSVNTGIPFDNYDDIPFKLKSKTIDQVVAHIRDIGPSAKLYIIDLERAYRKTKNRSS